MAQRQAFGRRGLLDLVEHFRRQHRRARRNADGEMLLDPHLMRHRQNIRHRRAMRNFRDIGLSRTHLLARLGQGGKRGPRQARTQAGKQQRQRREKESGANHRSVTTPTEKWGAGGPHSCSLLS